MQMVKLIKPGGWIAKREKTKFLLKMTIELEKFKIRECLNVGRGSW